MNTTQNVRYGLGLVLLGIAFFIGGSMLKSADPNSQVAMLLTLGGVIAVLVGLVRAGLALVRR